MDKATAQRLVRNTLKAPFDRKRYHGLVNELCNGFDDGKAQNMQVPDAFTAHVKSCQRLGTFTSPDEELADVLVVHLTESWKLERSRTALRDFVAHKLKRSDGSENVYKEAGLIAFVAPDSQSWRFSYVRMDYATKRDPDTGKIKMEERLTPARRYSYLVGAEEECHTAQTRFLALLQNTTAKPTLAQIEEAFSVESITKEFFNEYARLFKATDEALTAVVAHHPAIRADFAAKGVSTVDFAKKLLGQIVFLYFIQKKGWLGVGQGQSWGEGPRHFLRQLADQAVAKEQCLFNEVLEPLFYDSLATDRGADAWCPRFKCRIPFLNGGLFEPLAGYDWEQRSISLPNWLFTNRESTPAGDIGTGILDVFDRYNFTVNEAEPLEKEVAIDPEMLGKVFENLIEENRRKGLGAFYTPREIVHYMCQESLINYLDTTLNQSDKIIERADVEALIREGEQAAHYESARKDGTVSYQRQLPKSIEEQARVFDEALRNITVCDPAIGSGAFPVGMMTEIVRARMALTPYFDDATERTAYHFKRHAIQNSLYGVDIDGGAVEIAKLRLWLSLVVDEEDVQQIKPLPNLDYKVVAGNSLLGVEKNLFNEEYFKQLEALKPKFFDESDRVKKVQFKQQIDNLIYQLTKGLEVFDFEIYFSEVFHTKGGFDVLIGNPPYGANIDDFVVLFERLYPNTTKGFKDIYKLFIELAILKLLRANGTLCYITPNTLLRQPRYKDVRSFLDKYYIKQVLDFGLGVFECIVPTCVFLIEKNYVKNNEVRYVDLTKSSHFNCNLDAEKMKLIPQAQLLNLSKMTIEISRALPSGSSLVPLGDVLDLKDAGINYQRVNIGLAEKGKSDLGQRLLYEGQRECAEDVEYWKGEDIAKFYISPTTGRFVRIRTKMSLRANERIILNREYFTRVPKLLWRQTAPCLIAMVDEKGIWFGRSIQGATVKQNFRHLDFYFLVGVLNSAYLRYVYNRRVQEQGRVFPQVKFENIKPLPIVVVAEPEQRKIIQIVQRIIAVKKENPCVDISDFEHQIDQEVYQLYGLNEEEIALIKSV